MSGSTLTRGSADVRQIVGPARQVDIVVLGLGGPVAADGHLNAKPRGPAEMGDIPSRRHNEAEVIQVDVGPSPSEAAGDVGHPHSHCITEAATRSGNVIDGGVVRSRQEPGNIDWAAERHVDLDAYDNIVRKLPIVAGLITTDQASHTVRKKHALQRLRVGSRAKTADAIADMGT